LTASNCRLIIAEIRVTVEAGVPEFKGSTSSKSYRKPQQAYDFMSIINTTMRARGYAAPSTEPSFSSSQEKIGLAVSHR
jgi:hypothetical protein